MPQQINVTLKSDADASKLEDAKKKITEAGGKILHEFKLVKGFTAQVPDDHVSTLSADESLTVEKDGQVSTQ